ELDRRDHEQHQAPLGASACSDAARDPGLAAASRRLQQNPAHPARKRLLNASDRVCLIGSKIMAGDGLPGHDHDRPLATQCRFSKSNEVPELGPATDRAVPFTTTRPSCPGCPTTGSPLGTESL